MQSWREDSVLDLRQEVKGDAIKHDFYLPAF